MQSCANEISFALRSDNNNNKLCWTLHSCTAKTMRSLLLCTIVALTTSFAPVAPPKPTSTVVRSEPPKTSTPPINRATALSGGLLGGYLLLELGYGAYNSTKE